ncbi:SseB family protein [Streptomyces sp. NPDC012769]|uniref:SseB family protein n=1 Tax=Streptomyces sp. NPDC012769 TaxID=3364848 RepID=UPI0036AE0577
MIDNGEEIPGPRQVSRLAELADAATAFRPAPGTTPGARADADAHTGASTGATSNTTDATRSATDATRHTTAPTTSADTGAGDTVGGTQDGAGEPAPVGERFAELLALFRSTAVLVPFDPYGSLWTAEQNGVRWICAFSDEAALARFAYAQQDADRAWDYRTVLGSRLLDEMVPMLPGPAGVALDAGSPDGVLFPPVRGIVPDAVAVDLGNDGFMTHGGTR